MRYLLAALILCTLGAPAASAKAKHDSAAHAANGSRAAAHHHNRSLGGIHPLVGSGDY